MSKAKFTPGPWVLRGKSRALISMEIFDSEGNNIADTWDLGYDPKTVIANARLISASPELYEALEAIYELTWGNHPNGLVPEDYSRVKDQLIKALQKARGESWSQ